MQVPLASCGFSGDFGLYLFVSTLHFAQQNKTRSLSISLSLRRRVFWRAAARGLLSAPSPRGTRLTSAHRSQVSVLIFQLFETVTTVMNQFPNEKKSSFTVRVLVKQKTSHRVSFCTNNIVVNIGAFARDKLPGPGPLF